MTWWLCTFCSNSTVHLTLSDRRLRGGGGGGGGVPRGGLWGRNTCTFWQVASAQRT